MNAFKGLITFLLGAATGIAAGLLVAPSSGKKTREKLAKDVKEKKTEFDAIANEKLEEAKSFLNKTIDTGKEKLEKAKEKTDKAS